MPAIASGMPRQSASWRGIRRGSPRRTQAIDFHRAGEHRHADQQADGARRLAELQSGERQRPVATNSPDGIQITRVTANTSTSASASSA